MNKSLVIIGLVIGIFGVIFSLLPHDMHNSILGGIRNIEDHNNMKMNKEMPLVDELMQKENTGESHHSHGTHVAHITIGVLSAVIGFALAFSGWKIFD